MHQTETAGQGEKNWGGEPGSRGGAGWALPCAHTCEGALPNLPVTQRSEAERFCDISQERGLAEGWGGG